MFVNNSGKLVKKNRHVSIVELVSIYLKELLCVLIRTCHIDISVINMQYSTSKVIH